VFLFVVVGLGGGGVSSHLPRNWCIEEK